MQQPEFDQWCLLELMGHQRIAGKVTERTIAGQGFLEVSVPETTRNPKFTRFVSPSALYAINPIDEQSAKMYAENLGVKPIDSWDLQAFMAKVEKQSLLKGGERDAVSDQQPYDPSDVEYEDEEDDRDD